MRKKIVIFILFAFMFTMLPGTALAADIDRLEVVVDMTTLTAGETAQATATLHYSDGSSIDLTEQVTWQSQDEGIATVDNAGLITAQAQGDTIIDAIYTAPDMAVFSDQTQITVGSSVEVPYSVEFYPADGFLEPYEPIVMQFPCEVEIIQEYANPIKDYGRSYYLYQDTDKTKVYIKQVPHVEYRALFPDIEQLPWPKISARFNNLTDSFENHIKPANGVWRYTGDLQPYDFEAKEALPLELLGVYPNNGSTLHNVNLMGNAGYKLNSLLAPSIDQNVPVVYVFNQPINQGDISKFTISAISPSGGQTGHWGEYKYPSYSDLLWSYVVTPKPIYNYSVFGYALTDTQVTFNLEPGAFRLASNGNYNTETYSTTFTVNPSTADNPDLSWLRQGEIYPNAPPLTPGKLTTGDMEVVWRFNVCNNPIAQSHIETSGTLLDDIIVFGGYNCIYAIDCDSGNLDWTYSSRVNEAFNYLKPHIGPDGIIYTIDYKYTDNELCSLQPSIVALNQDGTIRFERLLPTEIASINTCSMFITETGDIVVIYGGDSLSGLGTRNFYMSRYSADGGLLATSLLDSGNLGSYGCYIPQVLYADENTAVIKSMSNNIAQLSLPQNGVFSSISPVWSTPSPLSTMGGRFSVSRTIKDWDRLFVFEGHAMATGLKEQHSRFIEIDLVTGDVMAHTPIFNPDPSAFFAPIGDATFVLRYQDGQFWYNNGFIYDANTKETILQHKPWSQTDDDYVTPYKCLLVGVDGDGKNINLYRLKWNDDGVTRLKYFFGGQGWYDNKAYLTAYPWIYQAFFDGDSMILDTSAQTVKLRAIPTPLIKPDKPGGGTIPTPEPPEDKPEPPVEPEPEPEPENVDIIEPEAEPEPELTDEPPVKPAPKVITVEEPEPVITGTVKGFLKMRDGRPLANVRLELHSKLRVTYTDSKGYFEFKNVALGNHKLYLADLKISDKKILLNTLQVATTGEEIKYIPISQTVKELEATQITLTETEPEKEVEMIIDFELPQDEPEKKTPIWPWLLLLLLLIILRRRHILNQEKDKQ